MPKPYKVAYLRKNFLADVESAEKLVEKVRSLSNFNPSGPPRSLHHKHVHRVVELAFMGVVSEWEDFLEQTFIRYLAGGESDNAFAANLKVGASTSTQHSYEILSQNSRYDPSRDYLRFSDPKWTLGQAEFFFVGGKPYDLLRPKLGLLQDANMIRNRIAHSSEKCKSDFKTVALRYTNPGANQLGQGYRVGNLLSAKAVRHFGQTAINKDWDYLKAFFELYSDLAKVIAP